MLRCPIRTVLLLCTATMIVLFGVEFAHAEGADIEPFVMEGTAPEVPDDLKGKDVPNLVSRLSDEDVRALLIHQLETIADAKDRRKGQSDFIGNLHGVLAQARERLRLMVGGIPALPSIGPFFVDQITRGQAPSIIWLKLLVVALIFAGGSTAEWLFRRMFSRFGEATGGAAPEGITDKISILTLRFIRDILALVVFGLAAMGLFFLFYQGNKQTREIIATIFWAVILFRAVAAFGRVALAPKAQSLRLAPLDDATAQITYSRLLLVTGSIIAATYFSALLAHLGLGEGLALALGFVLVSTVLGLIVALVWIDRESIGEMILRSATEGGQPPNRLHQILAANWHVFASSMLVVFWVLALGMRILTGERMPVALILSLSVLFGILVVNWIVKVAVSTILNVRGPNAVPLNRRAVGQDTGADGAASLPTTETDRRANEARVAYRDILVRNLRIVVVVISVVVLARVWRVDVQGVVALGIGEAVAGAMFDIIVTLILASAAWGILTTAIRYAVPEGGTESEAEAGEIGGEGGSRLQTVIPLLGRFLLVVLVVMAGLIILSELGINIGPLIAGAGIVGLAVGFGAQTLVKDILSGMFFLVDDAFRIGEYVDVGDVTGTVEHVSIRSLRLRHHNGPLHTIPFGEIKHLTNYSRDWAIMKLEIRVPFDTNLEKVRKIIKRVGLKLLEDPQHGPNLLEPVKSQGVHHMDDSAFVLRVKFMAKPGEQFVLRREVFRRIQEAFAENGINFAPRRVIVDTGAGPMPIASATAAAAATAGESPQVQSTTPPVGPDS